MHTGSDGAHPGAAAGTGKEHFGVEYNLTGPAALDHAQVARIISEVSGRQIQYHSLTEEAMLQGARDQGLPEAAVQYMGILYNAVRSGWMAPITGDVQRLIGRPVVHDAAHILLGDQLQVLFEQLPGHIDLGRQFEHAHL